MYNFVTFLWHHTTLQRTLKDGVGQLAHLVQAHTRWRKASTIEEQYNSSHVGEGGVEKITEQQQMKAGMVLSMLEEI